MKKLTSALAVAALVAAPAMASAQGPQVYGQIHTSLEMQDNGDDSGINLHSRASRVGVRGGAPLDVGNMMVIYQVETEINSAQGGGVLANRDTFVGLRGDFGMIRAGRFVPPSTVLRARADLFGDQMGNARNGMAHFAAFDNRIPNALGYAIELGSVGVDLFYSTSSGDPTIESDDGMYGLGVSYADGPLFVGATLEQYMEADGDDSVGPYMFNQDSTSMRLGASYTMGDLRFAGMFEYADWGESAMVRANPDDTSMSVGGGVAYSIDRLTLKGQAYMTTWDDRDDYDHTLIALGADYALSDATTAYAAFAMTMNDDNVAIMPYRAGDTGGVIEPVAGESEGEDLMSFGVGLIHRF